MAALARAQVLKRGRRPKGKGDPREDILQGAIREFARRGFDHATIRAIAHEAHVDPALVYHYFGDKESLFAEALRVRMRRPTEAEMPPTVSAAQRAQTVVRLFLERWGGDGATAPFLALLRSASSNPKAAALLRRAFEEEITPHVRASVGRDDVELRVGLVASTLLGLGVIRYIVRLDPIASATNEELARCVGPVLLRYLNEPLR